MAINETTSHKMMLEDYKQLVIRENLRRETKETSEEIPRLFKVIELEGYPCVIIHPAINPKNNYFYQIEEDLSLIQENKIFFVLSSDIDIHYSEMMRHIILSQVWKYTNDLPDDKKNHLQVLEYEYELILDDAAQALVNIDKYIKFKKDYYEKQIAYTKKTVTYSSRQKIIDDLNNCLDFIKYKENLLK